LILRLKDEDFNLAFHDHLYKAGRGYPAPRFPNMADNKDLSSSDDKLQEA
jgi:hypothetical protein